MVHKDENYVNHYFDSCKANKRKTTQIIIKSSWKGVVALYCHQQSDMQVLRLMSKTNYEIKIYEFTRELIKNLISHVHKEGTAVLPYTRHMHRSKLIYVKSCTKTKSNTIKYS